MDHKQGYEESRRKRQAAGARLQEAFTEWSRGLPEEGDLGNYRIAYNSIYHVEKGEYVRSAEEILEFLADFPTHVRLIDRLYISLGLEEDLMTDRYVEAIELLRAN